MKPGFNTPLTSAAYISPLTSWSHSAYQDKITGNKGLEHNQSMSTEATILQATPRVITKAW